MHVDSWGRSSGGGGGGGGPGGPGGIEEYPVYEINVALFSLSQRMYPSPSPNKMFQELYHRGHKVGQVYKDNVYLYNNFHFKIKYHVGSMPGKFRITGFEVSVLGRCRFLTYLTVCQIYHT